MKRHLTEHLAELAGPALAAAMSPGEGFEVVTNGSAVRWHQPAAPIRQDDRRVWQLAQADGPLRAVTVLQVDRPRRAASWQVELTNASDACVKLEQLYPLVVRFPRYNGPWRTLTAGGGTSENFYPPRAYRPRQRVVFGGQVRIESPPGGLSSESHLPILLAAAGVEDDADGLFAGMEYSGQWFLCLRHVGDGPFVRGQLKLTGIALEAGQTLSLPAACMGFFSGGLEAGTNALRRYVRDCVCPPIQPSADPRLPPVGYNSWFGIHGRFDEPLLRRQVERAGELGVECWVHGPGWLEGGFPAGAGNWQHACPRRHPDGLGPLADFVRRHDMKFGLWFEIERAGEGTQAAREHQELFLGPLPTWAGAACLLNLALPRAVDWGVETIARWVRALKLEWIGLDLSIDPAPFWRLVDPTGKLELAYCQGLYRLLDELRRAHPGLSIENSAAGGRRIDLGMLRRTHLNWISEQTFTPDICRYMQCRWNSFLPGHLANSAVAVRLGGGEQPGRQSSQTKIPKGHSGHGARLEDLDLLSRMCGALSFSGDIASWPAATARRAAKWVEAYKSIRPFLSGDFHQLLPTPATDQDWEAVQFAAPKMWPGRLDRAETRNRQGQDAHATHARNAGPAGTDTAGQETTRAAVVFAFRMGGSQDRACHGVAPWHGRRAVACRLASRARLQLRGLDPAADYLVTDLSRPLRPRTVAGQVLARRGLAVVLRPHAAKCMVLSKIPEPSPH